MIDAPIPTILMLAALRRQWRRGLLLSEPIPLLVALDLVAVALQRAVSLDVVIAARPILTGLRLGER